MISSDGKFIMFRPLLARSIARSPAKSAALVYHEKDPCGAFYMTSKGN
jgi:hypothetical protein